MRFFTSGEKELHRRKARVHETICVLDRSRLLVCSSFDSGPCLACLVRMRDEVLLLHNGDSSYLFCSGSETFLIQITGYNHVDILPPHQKYLGFSWTLAGEKKWFVLSVLTFRLASAPYVFTKIQKALVKHWREQCIRIFTYLDDGAASRRVAEDIAASGFVVHPEKHCWEPTQVRESLGFILNLDFLIDSDVSDPGRSGYCVNVAGTNVAGSWSEAQSRESSTWRKLRGMRLVLMSIGEELVGKTVRHSTDKMKVERVLKVGSPKSKLHLEAVTIYTLCKQYQIHLESE